MNRAPDRVFVEECWTLVGRRRGRVWYARRQRPPVGWPSAVAFDAAWALAREERGYVSQSLAVGSPGRSPAIDKRPILTVESEHVARL